MTDRELMQQALDALEHHTEMTRHLVSTNETIKALRARLAEPEPEELGEVIPADEEQLKRIAKLIEPEPVAWITDGGKGELWWHQSVKFDDDGNLIGENPDDIPLYTAPPQQPERKLWLWKNFVDGRPEYWAFDNPYPTNLDNGDPQTLGQPCGYAIFKPSRDGSRGRTEEQVLREMESVSARSEREWQGLTDEEVKAAWSQLWYDLGNGKFAASDDSARHTTIMFAKEIEAKLKEKNHAV